MKLIECLKDIFTIIGGVTAFITFIVGIAEYVKQGTQKRAEQFVEMRKRFKENESFREISSLLENDDLKLASEPYKDRRDYLGFFEEIALMVNSSLIKVDVAYYMFGYYVIKCWESSNFWIDIHKESQYWILFKEFYLKMKKAEENFHYEEKNFRI